jgi:hypothetical protein
MKKKLNNNCYRLLMLLLFFLNTQFATAQLFGGSLKSNKKVFIGGTFNGFTYNLVTSATGEVWLDRNLGATQVATSSTDHLAYGSLYQWGRGTDGHQLINWTGSTTGTAVNGTTTTLSTSDAPVDSLFIKMPNTPYDWRSGQNDNLWQGVNGINNPCPAGYRVPTETELDAERASWSNNNAAGAFASPLKLPLTGYRSHDDGVFVYVSTYGYLLSSTVIDIESRVLYFSSNASAMFPGRRGHGLSVRCIKD